MEPLAIAIASLGAARDMARGYVALKDEIARQQFAIDMQSKILEAQGAALDAQAAHQVMANELQTLRGELAALRDQSSAIAAMERDAGFYFLPGDLDPFCPHCVEVKQQPVHLSKSGFTVAARREWRCPACKNSFLQQSPRFKNQPASGTDE